MDTWLLEYNNIMDQYNLDLFIIEHENFMNTLYNRNIILNENKISDKIIK